MPITDESFIPNSTDLNPAVRLSINLRNTCPTNFATMTGVALDLEERRNRGYGTRGNVPVANGGLAARCLSRLLDGRPGANWTTCARERISDDQNNRQTIEQILGTNGACMYLCRFGKVSRGDDPGDLQGFEINYGDEVAALFSTRIVDTRSYRATRCAGALGQLVGMFRFELVRSRSAQPFP